MLTACPFRPAAAIPNITPIFNNQFIALSNSFFPINTTSTITYTDEKGLYYAALLKRLEGKGEVRTCVAYIDDAAGKDDVNQFVGLILERVKELGTIIEYFDESAHGAYTTNIITQVMSKTHSIWDYWLTHVQYHASTRPGKEVRLREGYEIRACGAEHAEHVVMVHYSPDDEATKEGFMSLMRENLQHRPSYGVFRCDDSTHGTTNGTTNGTNGTGGTDDGTQKASHPVAWFTMYDDCTLGALHVMKDYRGLGFGRALVRHSMNVISKMDDNFRFVVNIASSNNGSRVLFESEGYVRLERNPMMIFCHKSMDTPPNMIIKS